MPLPVEAHVRDVLSRNHRGLLLRDAFLGGWDTFRDKHPDRAWWRRKSTRAALMWEYTVANVIAAFQEDKAIKPIPHFDTISLIIEDAVLLRIKKASVELRTSNVQTILASMFHEHDADLFGYSGLQRVEAAYVLNKLESEIAWVGVVARDKKLPLWHFELDDGKASSAPLPLPLPVEPPKSPDRLVKLKPPAQDKKPASKSE